VIFGTIAVIQYVLKSPFSVLSLKLGGEKRMLKRMCKREGNTAAIFLTAMLALSIGGFIMMPAKSLAANPPEITLLPPAAPVGTPITVNGANFQSGATVDLSWFGYILDVPNVTGHIGYYPIKTGITVASDGTFHTTIIAPYDFSDIAHFVNATQNGEGTGITNATFTIVPTLSLSPQPTNYTDGQEVFLNVYGAPLGTAAFVMGLNPLNEVDVLKLTYDNAMWGFVVSHLTTEGPIVTAGFTGGDIGGNATIRFNAVGDVGQHVIRAYEGTKDTPPVPYLPCEIGGQAAFTIVGPSLDAQAILSKLSSIDAEIVSVQGDTAVIKTNLGNFTVSLSDIDAKIVSLQGSMATVTTSLGTLNGTVTSVNNGVATIQTNLGALTVSEAGVKDSSDTTRYYALVAIALAVINLIILVVIAARVFRKS
jgi:hypothetical protein